MSVQNPLNQMERLHPECYSGCHIWLGQYHQHSACSPIRIIRPRGQIQSWCSSIQHPVYLLRFQKWRCSSGRPRTTWLDHISSDTSMTVTDTLSLAQDRLQWRAVAMATKATCTWLTDWLFGLKELEWQNDVPTRLGKQLMVCLTQYARWTDGWTDGQKSHITMTQRDAEMRSKLK